MIKAFFCRSIRVWKRPILKADASVITDLVKRVYNGAKVNVCMAGIPAVAVGKMNMTEFALAKPNRVG